MVSYLFSCLTSCNIARVSFWKLMCYGIVCVGDALRTSFVRGGALVDWENTTPNRRQCMVST